jgi:Tfp pilus assembly protein PilN
VDQKLILNLVEKTKSKNQEFLEFSRKHLSVVALTEISNLTPTNIRLTSISVRFADKTGGKEPPQKNVTLEGIVLGNRTAFESALAGYLIQLSGSPLFKQPVINQKEPGFFNDKEVLRFTAQLKLV